MKNELTKEQERKAEEAYYFRRFCELSGRDALEPIEQPNPPAPDIVFVEEGRRIGVELTRSVTNQEARRTEDEVEKIVGEAKRRFEAAGGPPLLVGLFWKDGTRPRRSSRVQIADDLTVLVKKHQPDVGCEAQLGWGEISDSLQSFVYRVDICRWPGLRHGLWQAPKATGVLKRNTAEIEERLAAKEKHVAKYREYCEEVWLLVYAESHKHSSWWQLPSETAEAVYSSRFDRVFVLADWPRRVIELRVTNLGISESQRQN